MSVKIVSATRSDRLYFEICPAFNGVCTCPRPVVVVGASGEAPPPPSHTVHAWTVMPPPMWPNVAGSWSGDGKTPDEIRSMCDTWARQCAAEAVLSIEARHTSPPTPENILALVRN